MRAAQLGEQRVGDSAGRGREHGVGIGEVLFEDVGELAVGEREAPAHAQAERVGRGGAVERDRDLRPPVDDDRFAVGIVDRATTHVEDFAQLFFYPPEAQHGRLVLERAQALHEVPAHRGAVELSGGEILLVHVALGAVPHLGETLRRERQVGAFALDVGVRHRADEASAARRTRLA